MPFLTKLINWLLPADSSDPLVRVLRAWRLWVGGAILGALIAAAVYALFPPPYRASATVIVDHNVEEAWTYFPDRRLFYFLDRETRRLEAIAWSDTTLDAIAAEVPGVIVEELRTGTLLLSQPSDGGWHFWAQDADPARASALASVWAQAFVENVRASIAVNPELEAARLELQAAALQTPPPNEDVFLELEQRIAAIIEQTQGVSPFVEVSLAQSESLPVSRAVDQAVYLVVGSLVGALGLAWLALFISNNEQ